MRDQAREQLAQSGGGGQIGRCALACCFALLLLGGGNLFGCRAFPRQTAGVTRVPEKHSVRVENLLLVSDFKLSKKDPLVLELQELRERVVATLKLPEPRRDVMVYLFSDQETYRAYLAQLYPGLPDRRAYFVGTSEELAVYTFWGNRIQEDLRHEATHGILHASLAGVPLWLDEGLAEYFEVPGSPVGGMNGDYPQQLAMATSNGWRPDLDRLESIEEFTSLQRIDYQESWAWVHYLLHSSPETRQELLAYIVDLRDSPQPERLASRLEGITPAYSDRFLSYMSSMGISGSAVIRAAHGE